MESEPMFGGICRSNLASSGRFGLWRLTAFFGTLPKRGDNEAGTLVLLNDWTARRDCSKWHQNFDDRSAKLSKFWDVAKDLKEWLPLPFGKFYHETCNEVQPRREMKAPGRGFHCFGGHRSTTVSHRFLVLWMQLLCFGCFEMEIRVGSRFNSEVT